MTRPREAGRSIARSLRQQPFRLFFVGQAISQIGTWMQTVATTLLVLRLSDANVSVGLASMCYYAPTLVLGAWSGVLADRLDRKRLLLAVAAAGLVVAAVYAALVVAGAASLPVVFVVTAVSGLVLALENPVRRCFIGDLVEPALLPNAIALNSAVVNVAKILGPAFASWVVLVGGIEWCFAVRPLTFIPQLWLFAKIRPRRVRSVDRPRARGQLQEGLRYTWAAREVRSLLLLASSVGMSVMTFGVLVPVFFVRTIDGGESSYTTAVTVISIGSLVGTLLAARRESVGVSDVVRWCVVLAGATVMLAASPTYAISLVACAWFGCAMMLAASASNTAVQLRVEDRYSGRVLALYSVVIIGCAPVAGPLAGWTADVAGPRAALVGTALVSLAVIALVARALPVRSHQTTTIPDAAHTAA